MLKLIKVEFRKGLAGALVLLGIAAALQAYYLISLYSSREGHTIAAALLLVWVTFAMGVFVFARGITAYSRELGSRTGYMLFLTPNPSLKIIGSKFLYTFLLALLLSALMGALAWLDLKLLFSHYPDYANALRGSWVIMKMQGLPVAQLAGMLLLFAVSAYLRLLQAVATVYLAVTVTQTLLGDRKWRWLPSLLLFLLLNWLLNRLGNRLSPITFDPEAEWMFSLKEMLRWALPQACLSLAVVLASLFGCAWLLDHKLSL